MAQKLGDKENDGYSAWGVGKPKRYRILKPFKFNLEKRMRAEGRHVMIVINGKSIVVQEIDIPPGYKGPKEIVDNPS